MPYYKWTGIDLQGKLHKGNDFTRSIEELDSYLLRQEVGLVAARVDTWYILTHPITEKEKISFLEHLSTLIKAEIRLHIALTIIAQTMPDSYFKIIVTDVSKAIEEGKSLAQALALHAPIFDDLT